MKDFKNDVLNFDCSVFDYWMRVLNHSEFKVLLVVYRKTVSINKYYERISQIEIANISGITTRSVRTAINSLENKGLVITTGNIKSAKVFSVDKSKIHNVNLNINNFENTENRGDRVALSQAIRTMVFEKDAYRCVNCGEHRLLEVDHIVPVCKGGGNEFENLQTLCATCNSKKGTLSMDDWIKSTK